MARFINPYNFIPFDNKTITKVESGRSGELFTGSIEYTLKTVTPLIIPNTSNSDIFSLKGNDEHKSYEFFSYDDLSHVPGNSGGKVAASPIIPGSEIRGMFRSNYEIITDSCLPFTDSDQLLHKRVAGFFSPGLIKKVGENNYELIGAKDCLFRTKGANNLDFSDQLYDIKNKDKYKYKYKRASYIQRSLREGQQVYVELEYRDGRCKPLVKGISESANMKGYKEGYVIKGMPGPDMGNEPKNKHCAHIFVPNDAEHPVKENVDVSRLTDTLDIYQLNDDKAYKEYYSEWKLFLKGKTGCCFPVYYSKVPNEGKYIYLSPASGTMEVYKEKIERIINKKCACSDRKKLCPACSLFGMLNDSGDGVASNVRFSDLRLAESKDMRDLYEKIITLQELASPKLQNMEFYVKRPSNDAQFWTYEYWIDMKGRMHLYDDDNPLELNGRKFYWHSKRVAPCAKEKTRRNITVRPLKSNIRFIGEVFFNKISRKELTELIWLINCGENEAIDSKTHGYKLGHAKPLGYGSIAVSVSSVKIRKLITDNESITVDYIDRTEEFVAESVKAFEKSETRTNFIKMTDFNYLEKEANGMNVSYPRARNSEEIYAWFVKNHGKHSQQRKRKGGKIDRERWEYADVKSVTPNDRTQMVFREYMEPMQPKLVPVYKEKQVHGHASNGNNCRK